MYSCIYFHENASLGIAGKKDKNLKILEEFKERCLVEMKWGKTLYRGTIIKTDECKESLEKFATRVNSKVLKGFSSVPKEVPQELFSINGEEELALGKRRKLVQEEEKKQEDCAEEVQEAQQTTKKQKKQKIKTQKGTSATRSSKVQEKKKKDLESAADLTAATSMCLQFDDTPLTETWDLCCGSSRPAAVHVGSMMTPSSETLRKSLPDPPSELLDIIKVLYKPEVKAFFEAFTRHYSSAHDTNIAFGIQELSNRTHTYSPARTKPTLTITHNMNAPQPSYNNNIHTPHQMYEPEPDFTNRPTQILPYPDYTSSQMFDISFTTQDTISSPSNYMHTSTLLQSTHSLPQQQDSHLTDTISSYSLTDITRINQTPNKQGLQPAYASFLPVSSHDTSDVQEKNMDRNVPAEQPVSRRTSPRKSLNTGQKPPVEQATPVTKYTTGTLRKTSKVVGGDQMKVKLIDSSDIVVDRDLLRKATSAAMKSQNPGHALCKKILPPLFTTIEMARSRGQGLTKKKEGDIRPVLDKEKIVVMKDYVV